MSDFTGATGSIGKIKTSLPDELKIGSNFGKHQLEIREQAMERESEEAGVQSVASTVHLSNRGKAVMAEIKERARLEGQAFPIAKSSTLVEKKSRFSKIVGFFKKMFGAV